MPDKFDLVVNTGSDQTWRFRIVDNACNDVDTAGYTARMQVRPRIGSDVVYDELTTENGRLKFTEDGFLDLEMPSDVTDTYMFKTALYDIEIVNKEGRVTRLVEGRVIARHGVTL